MSYHVGPTVTDDVSSKFRALTIDAGARTRSRALAEDRERKKIKIEPNESAFQRAKSAIVWGFEEEETDPLSKDEFKRRVGNIKSKEELRSVLRLTKTGSKFFAFFLALCKTFVSRSTLIWDSNKPRDTSDVTMPENLLNWVMLRDALFHEDYSDSGDFIFWHVLFTPFHQIFENPKYGDFGNFRTIGCKNCGKDDKSGILSDEGVRKFVDWLADEERVREDTRGLARFVMNFRPSEGNEEWDVDEAQGMRWFMREEDLEKEIRILQSDTRAILTDLDEKMLIPFGLTSMKNPLPANLWERIRDMNGSYVEDFKSKTCEEQKKICKAVPRQMEIANTFSCAREPLKSIHEDTCAQNFLRTFENRRSVLESMTEEARLTFTRNVTKLFITDIREANDPIFKLKLPKLRELSLISLDERKKIYLSFYSITMAMKNLEILRLDGMKVTNHNSFVKVYDDEIREVHALQITNAGMTGLTITSDNLKYLDISGNVLRPDLLRLGKNIETLILRNTKLTSLPPAVAKITSLRHLDLSHNEMRTFPDVFELKQLVILDVSHNKIRNVPSSISDLTRLETLSLEENNIVLNIITIPPTFSRLENLIELRLDGNKSDEGGYEDNHRAWPMRLKNLSKLNYLTLPISEIPLLTPELREKIKHVS